MHCGRRSMIPGAALTRVKVLSTVMYASDATPWPSPCVAPVWRRVYARVEHSRAPL